MTKRLFALGRTEMHHCQECNRPTEHIVTTIGKLKWGIIEEWQVWQCLKCQLISQWGISEVVK